MKRLFLLLVLLPLFCHAEIVPTPGKYDARVRVVPYNPMDVVTIRAYFGVSTHVSFKDDEVVDQKALGMGDAKGWQIGFSSSGRDMFLRPVAEKADTNLTVITNKRRYHFLLLVDPAPVKEETFRSTQLMYAISFTYPEDEAAKAKEKDKENEVKKRFDDVKEKLADASAQIANNDYWVAGSEEISPTGATDDGRFTRLTFSNNRDFPAIFAVDAQGRESLVRKHVEGNTVVVQRVYRKLILRLGEAVACVVNKSFDLDAGIDNATGTVSPGVERVLKGAPQ